MKFVYVSPSISGRVADAGNNPFAGVTITTDQGQSTTTDSNGNFTIANPLLSYGYEPSEVYLAHTQTVGKYGKTSPPPSPSKI